MLRLGDTVNFRCKVDIPKWPSQGDYTGKVIKINEDDSYRIKLYVENITVDNVPQYCIDKFDHKKADCPVKTQPDRCKKIRGKICTRWNLYHLLNRPAICIFRDR